MEAETKVDLMGPLDAWVEVVWKLPDEEVDPTTLYQVTKDLRDALGQLIYATGDYPDRSLSPFFSQAHAIIRNLIGLSGQYLWQDYTDSDVDARCDLEWDVHSLARAIDPHHDIPESVTPAYVMGTVYPTPEV
jgi:hypothetical protein